MNNKKIILDLCGGTGSWSKPYKDNGYDVRVITLPDYDVCTYEPPKGVYGILSAPPCTHFSIARNEKTAKAKRNLQEAMKPVEGCLRIIWKCSYHRQLKFWAMENPNGYLKLFMGKPILTFHPYEYGDPYTKKTCLWGNFNDPKKDPVEPRDFEHPTTKGARDFVSCVEHFADLKTIPEGYKEKTGYTNRTILRSMTPDKFAQAFYKANQ